MARRPCSGIEAQEIVGRNVALLGPAGAADDAARCLEMVMQGHTVRPFDTVLLAKDGRKIDVSLSISPIRGAAGEVVGAAGIARDIGQRLQAERRLRESEERFRQAFEHAPAGMSIVAADWRILQVNAALCRILGYSAPELLATTWIALTHPGDVESTLLRREKLLQTPNVFQEAEKRYLHRNGTTVWTRTNISTIRDSGGNQLDLLHVEDITDRKRAEEMLRESEDRFRTMADGCPAAMWVTGADGGNQFVNRAYRELCGVTYDAVEGARWPLLLHPDDAPDYVESFQRAVREYASFRAEVRVRNAAGEWRWLSTYAEPRFSPGGEFLGHTGISPDITERKRAEEALRAAEARRRMMAQALESTAELISITDTEGRLLYVNAAFLRAYGYREDELIGQPAGMLRSGRTALDAQRQILPATMAGNWSGELWNRTKDGREFPISLNTSVVYDEEGRGIALVGIASDITGRRSAEEALRTARENAEAAARHHEFQHSLIRAVFEGSPDGILAVNPDGIVVAHNQRFLDSWRISLPHTANGPCDGEAGIEDRPILSAVVDRVKDSAAFLERVRQLYADPDADDHCEIELKDGRTIERFSTSLRKQPGGYLGRVWFFRDITERKRAEQALESSEEKFRQLAENIREVFWMITPEADEILYISPAYEQVWGRTCESLYRNPASWMEAIHPDDAARAHALFAGQLRGESVDRGIPHTNSGRAGKMDSRPRRFPFASRAEN